MKLLIVQLSDIHIISNNDPILLKKTKLLDAIQNETLEVDEIVLLITGDTAFSGSSTEFEIGGHLFSEIKSYLEEYSNKTVRIIVIPGNHDCSDLTEKNIARETLIKSAQESNVEDIDNSIINILSSVLDNFFTFSKQFDSESSIIYSDKLLTILEFLIEGKKVLFYNYNTSFQSILHEQPGKMVFPFSKYETSLFDQVADLKISTFHHPLHWLSPNNRRGFKEHIEKTSDFYFTGHEHEHRKSLISDLEDNYTYNVEGDVLQESNDPNRSGFNLIFFDLENSKFLIKNFKWVQDKYATSNEATAWTNYNRGRVTINNPYRLKSEFKKYLNDIGAHFSHPIIGDITLSDVFIYPKLEQLNSSEKEYTVTEDSEKVISSLKQQFRILLSGSENIGKTTLLKTIYGTTLNIGLVPVFIRGYEIKGTSLKDFQKVLLRHFQEQYSSTDSNDLFQLSKSKIVILIDDFNKVNLNVKYRANLITTLINAYDNIIISGNELMSLEDIMTDSETIDDLYSTFTMYEVMEFGHVLRSKLINKWILLGRETTISDEERIKRLHHAEGIIKKVVGENFVPNYPFFILTILQSIEFGNPTDLTASTFGYYYQYLIQKSFGNTLKNQDEITSYNNYLSELAFYLFNKRIRNIDLTELESFDTEYRKEYTISHSLSEITINLEKAKIIYPYDSNFYEFKYQYIYYFFVSYYLSNNIGAEKTKQIISALCKRLYKTEFANILMFLTHHSKDSFLLEELLKNSRDLFDGLNPCKLEDDIIKINELGKELPKLVYRSKSVDEHREQINKEMDEQPKNDSKEISEIPDLNEDITEIDIISQLNIAFKTIEILGQILKNNYGKITNPVIFQLVEETYLLGLRTLNVFFGVIEDNTDFFINQINAKIKEEEEKRGNNISEDEIRSISQKILFGGCSQMSYNFIKKISDVVGTKNLRAAYEQILSKHSYHSVKLIDFSIRLDHFGTFPNAEMRKLKADFRTAPLPSQVMRRLVMNYLYLFPTTEGTKQQILAELGISMQEQRRIEHTSTKKR